MAAVQEPGWDVNEAPPPVVRRARNAGRQFGGSTQPGATESAPAPKARRSKEEIAQSKAEAESRRQARASEQKAKTEKMTRRRRNWERSKAGQARSRDIVDYATEQHNKLAEERPELGLTKQKRLKLTHAQAYAHYGFEQHPEGPGIGEQQLPGMEDPHALATPKRWEDHSPKQQEDIQRRVKAASGATLDTMTRDFGAQLDQAYLRARRVGAKEPFAMTFYHPHGEAGSVLHGHAAESQVPMGLIASANADTSPKMTFRFVSKAGQVSYPNAELAHHVVKQVQAGVDPNKVTKTGLAGKARSVINANMYKAARRAHQVIFGGKTVPETYAHHGGEKSGFGPKTAAYHNSWLPGHPDYFVSDIHSGGGGMLPHLGHEQPLRRDEQGNVVINPKTGRPMAEKAEREEAMEVSGWHAMADYAARQAMEKRGIRRLRQGQAAQWGEEQIQRHEKEPIARLKSQLPSEAQSYPPIAHPVQFGHHQGTLF